MSHTHTNVRTHTRSRTPNSTRSHTSRAQRTHTRTHTHTHRRSHIHEPPLFVHDGRTEEDQEQENERKREKEKRLQGGTRVHIKNTHIHTQNDALMTLVPPPCQVYPQPPREIARNHRRTNFFFKHAQQFIHRIAVSTNHPQKILARPTHCNLPPNYRFKTKGILPSTRNTRYVHTTMNFHQCLQMHKSSAYIS